MVLMHVGLLAEARESFCEALASQADDPLALSVTAQAALFQGRYDEAREYIERSHRADPAHWLTQVVRPSMWLYQGDLAGAEQLIQTARQRRPDEPLLDACEALLWAKRGEPARAEAALARAVRDRPSVAHDHHRWHYAAATHAVLGRPREAVVQLRIAAETGLPNAPGFRKDPHLAPLADDPGMQALLAELDRHEREIRAELGRT
jgi:predicted Zn-dependent protease